jgi:FkbM family methyltransferase
MFTIFRRPVSLDLVRLVGDTRGRVMWQKMSRFVERARQSTAGLLHELHGAYRLSADPRSFARFASDVILVRVGRRVPIPGKDRERSVRVRGGVQMHYRLNGGDLQSIREVWMDECYRLPFELLPKTIVDLGANIGLTSLWFAHHYRGARILAVEPSPENARLVRLNLEGNGVAAEVIEGAIGPRDGTARFQSHGNSNMGHLSDSGEPVPVFSMETVLRKLPAGAEVDLVKLDIEGGEGPLLAENVGWLGRVRAVIAEFHPEVIDYRAVVQAIESQGFRYFPAHSAAGFDSMDAFIRESSPARN